MYGWFDYSVVLDKSPITRLTNNCLRHFVVHAVVLAWDPFCVGVPRMAEGETEPIWPRRAYRLLTSRRIDVNTHSREDYTTMSMLKLTSKTLNAITSSSGVLKRSLADALLNGICWSGSGLGLADWFRMAVVGFVFFMDKRNGILGVYALIGRTRAGLAYGPNEYIEESHMAYQHKLALVKLSVPQG